MTQRPPPGPARFDDLYREHAGRVLQLTRLLGVSPDDQRLDVAQEVWCVVFRRLADMPGPDKERAWITTTVRYCVLSWRRTKGRHPELYAQADEAPETVDLGGRTPETAAEKRQALEAAWVFLCHAIQDEARRDAYVLHEVGGLTVEEVAEATDIPFKRAQSRLRMANADLEKARRAMSEKDRKLRAVLWPFASAEALKQALQTPIPDEDIAEVWRRVQERIALDTPPDNVDPEPPSAPPEPPPGHPFTSPHLVKAGAGVFGAGMIAGALLLRALQSHEPPPPAPIMTTETWPTPVATPESATELAPRPTEAPPAPTSTSPAHSSTRVATSAADASTLLIRIRTAVLAGEPAEALTLAEEHARRFPQVNAAEREELAIRALVQIGRRPEAEERAEKLMNKVPSSRGALESILGHQSNRF